MIFFYKIRLGELFLKFSFEYSIEINGQFEKEKYEIF